MRVAAIGMALVGLAGCTATGTQVERDLAAGGSQAMVCNAAGVQARIGQRADQAVGSAIMKGSGARTLRWGPPNSAWTMDYREDRVNVRYDRAMKITEITCG